MAEKIIVWAFDKNGNFYLQYDLYLDAGLSLEQIEDVIKEHRGEFPPMDLVIVSASGPRKDIFIPRLLRYQGEDGS